MAAIVIPIVTNWSVTPQNGQENYFVLMNTWLSESTSVIASLNTAIVKINESNTQSNSNLVEVINARDITVQARDEAVSAIATLTAGAIDDTTIAPNKAFSNSYIESNYYDKDEVDTAIFEATLDINSLVDKPIPSDNDNIVIQETGGLFKKLSFTNLKLWILSLFNPSLTANATLTGIDNKIIMNGIVSALNLEIGDVIQFTTVANANNQKMRTVEMIIDNNTIIVNYEHSGNRGDGDLKLSNESLTNAKVVRISKYYNAALGLGQSPVDVRNFRVSGVEDWGTLYSNTINRPIPISFVVTDTSDSIKGCAIRVNELMYAGSVVGQVGFASSTASVNTVIPTGANYRLMRQTNDSTILTRETR